MMRHQLTNRSPISISILIKMRLLRQIGQSKPQNWCCLRQWGLVVYHKIKITPASDISLWLHSGFVQLHRYIFCVVGTLGCLMMLVKCKFKWSYQILSFVAVGRWDFYSGEHVFVFGIMERLEIIRSHDGLVGSCLFSMLETDWLLLVFVCPLIHSCQRGG